VIEVEALSQDVLYVEAVPSSPRFLKATRACGKMQFGYQTKVMVYATEEALLRRIHERVFINVRIRN
jgi:hypothetical protein